MNLSIIYINDSLKIINVPFTNVTKDGFFSHTFSEKAFIIGIIIDSNLKTNYQSFKNELSPLENYYYQKEYPPLSIDAKEFRDKGSELQFQVDGLGLTQSYPQKYITWTTSLVAGKYRLYVYANKRMHEYGVVRARLYNLDMSVGGHDVVPVDGYTQEEVNGLLKYDITVDGNPIFAPPRQRNNLQLKQKIQF